MITKENERMSVGGGFLSVEEFYGLSTDTKPTNTANGSTFFEMDTGKMYRFNFSGTTWTETTHYGGDGFGPAPSGGGSGGGVLMIEQSEDIGSFNKTYREVKTAFLAGSTVIWRADNIDGLYYSMNGLDGLSLSVGFEGGTLKADSEDGYLYMPD